MNRFNSVLVANRGEIACRVMRTAQSLGYHTVAVYSEADAQAPHVHMADAAVCIGAAPVGESYLVAEKIIEAARSSGAQAIHPGYGFLSENAQFAKACTDAGLVFIGPDANAIEVMGNKAEAKRRMIAAGVPCVPGYEGKDQSDATLLSAAAKLGMPVMVKAAAGGGGRGMRLVENESELANAISQARAEAESAFGSGELILERAVIRPRHVEVQVFGDEAGNIVHLGERDCSVQRRHQKVVEEAPCPVVTPALRERMGAAAVEAARSINYVGAGTVEFLLADSGEFYFLEMNTRLQVEHPVTELITQRDLVALQLQVAQGQPLGFEQQDVVLSGHAIEVRLYTEDPAQEFLPMSGPVALWKPAAGPGVRIDCGIASGQDISPYYDPMVAKIIASGPDRETARRRLVEALQHTVLFGTKTNKEFLGDCLENKVFICGGATTAFIGEQFDEAALKGYQPAFADCAVAAVVEIAQEFNRALAGSVIVGEPLKNWSSTASLVSRKQYRFGEDLSDLWITPLSANSYRVTCGDDVADIEMISCSDDTVHVAVNGTQQVAYYLSDNNGLHLSVEGHYAVYQDLIKLAGKADAQGGGGRVVAPMHGLLLEVLVEAGDVVSAGQQLAVLEAMKMHYEILAEIDGTVREVLALAGTQVAADDVLLEITPNEEADAA